MIDRINRLLLLLIGTALVVGGVVALGFERHLQSPADVYRTVSDLTGQWLVAAMLLGGPVLTIVGLRVLLAQIRTPIKPQHPAVIVEDGPAGRVAVTGPALAKAFGAACATTEGVTRAVVHLRSGKTAYIDARVDLSTNADPEAVLAALGTTLRRARTTVEDPALPARIRLRHTDTEPPRVA